jgi:hypothetical protein
VPLQGQRAERSQRKTGDRYAIVEHAVRVREGKADFSLFASLRGGVRQAPMNGHRLPRPDRAHFRCGIVAKRKYEIECRRFRARELRPVGAQAGYVIVQLAQQIERIGMDAALRMASSREGAAITRPVARSGGEASAAGAPGADCARVEGRRHQPAHLMRRPIDGP